LKSSVLEGNHIVLGADGNLGPFWVRAIVQSGGKVWGLGLKATSNLELKKLSLEFPGKLEVIDFDLNSQTVASLAGLLPGDFSGVVLNAGIDSLPGTGHSRIEEFTAEDWEATFKVNVFGNINFLNYLLNSSKLSQASIVFIGSMYSLVSPPKDLYSHFNDGKGATKNPAYAASKAALASAVRQYGTNLASRGLRVNMLSPGGVLGAQDEHFLTKFRSKTPSGKMINPAILGDHLVYLLSYMSTSLVGQNLIIDDGYSVW
jgi:NAD(P)-dependent dehydrogenase (short-subunit alcohol dehydrogenase family)